MADRKILTNQAYNPFSVFPDDALARISLGNISKKGKVPKNGSIFFGISQTFMSGRNTGHPDGTPMSAQQFMKTLFGKLPDFFKNEAELRAIWSGPATRKKLLQGLADNGFGGEQLAEMQKIIDAEKSDLFHVLAHVAYAVAPMTREARATRARVYIRSSFINKQQGFLDFMLSHYVRVSVEELDLDKLTPLLKLKYHDSIPDAVAELGQADQIRNVFAGFQKFLCQKKAVA